MGHLASRCKTNWSVDPNLVRKEADKVMERAEKEGLLGVIEGSFIAERTNLFGYKCLSDEQASLLLKGSISPLPLHKTLTLLSLIEDVDLSVREVMRLSVAWSLVNETGNLRFGPEVGITKPKEDADVFGVWRSHLEGVALDLESAPPSPRALVFHGDAREFQVAIPLRSVDCVITSPPYPNEKDYTRTTRLESVLLGLVSTKQELRSLKRTLVRSNTRSVYVDDIDHLEVESFAEVQRVAAEIERRRVEMGKTSGFERLYHKVTRSYFGGMRRHLVAIAPYLKPGARLAYVVGDQASYLQVLVKTGQLLAEIAEKSGYEVESIDLFRTRLSTATKAQLREEVVVLRWPGHE